MGEKQTQVAATPPSPTGPQPADITVLIPTRGRRELVAQRLRDIAHRPLRLVIDRGRRAQDLPEDLLGATVLECEPDCGAPRALEAGLRAVQTPFVLYLTDDCEPAPDLVEKAAKVYARNFGTGPGVVALNDGVQQGRQACFGLIARQFYLDHCFPTPYQRYYQDTELSDKARWLGCYAYAPRARARHFFADGQNELIMAEDAETFHERMDQFRRRTPRHEARVMIGLPIYQGVEPRFLSCLMQLIKSPPLPLQIEFTSGDSLISRARNSITAKFLDSDCTHLLFIDSDIVFEPRDVARLVENRLDIVAGFYPKKQIEPDYCYNDLRPEAPRVSEPRAWLRQVAYVGTGFMLVARRVFETMIDRHGDQLRFISDFSRRLEHDFWQVGVYEYPDGTRRHLSEDWYFCQRALDLGFQVWGDTRIRLQHVGTAVYPLAQKNFAPEVSTNGSDRAVDGVIAPIATARNLTPPRRGIQPPTRKPQPA